MNNVTSSTVPASGPFGSAVIAGSRINASPTIPELMDTLRLGRVQRDRGTTLPVALDGANGPTTDEKLAPKWNLLRAAAENGELQVIVTFSYDHDLQDVFLERCLAQGLSVKALEIVPLQCFSDDCGQPGHRCPEYVVLVVSFRPGDLSKPAPKSPPPPRPYIPIYDGRF
ncbi:hypothetical protein [Deinococcus marmoris]|uniref:hypothetical protein n=1 Tax=Deinococcus marmoris TaxID=249408 RepID=UPI00096A6DDB|nr:hypothetical protein [Deinococcus marmoris]